MPTGKNVDQCRNFRPTQASAFLCAGKRTRARSEGDWAKVRAHGEPPRRGQGHSGKRPAETSRPAGQSIADDRWGRMAPTDATILGNATASFTAIYGLKRVYYSAFSPRSPRCLGEAARGAAASWGANTGFTRPTGLLRFYGFGVVGDHRRRASDGNLDSTYDPKLAWALENRGIFFPAIPSGPSARRCLRVPGFGTKDGQPHPWVYDTAAPDPCAMTTCGRMGAAMKKAAPFVQPVRLGRRRVGRTAFRPCVPASATPLNLAAPI